MGLVGLAKAHSRKALHKSQARGAGDAPQEIRAEASGTPPADVNEIIQLRLEGPNPGITTLNYSQAQPPQFPALRKVRQYGRPHCLGYRAIIDRSAIRCRAETF
jgi:hypothetical protein